MGAVISFFYTPKVYLLILLLSYHSSENNIMFTLVLLAILLSTCHGHGNMVYPPVWQDNPTNPKGLDGGFLQHGGFIGCGNKMVDENNKKNGDGCVTMWYNNFTTIPGSITLPRSMRTFRFTNNTSKWAKNPWGAPGTAPIYSPCGVNGGNPEGCPKGNKENGRLDKDRKCVGDGFAFGFYAERYFNNRPTPVTDWKRGEVVNAAFTLLANHGGGYQYRLCPIPDGNKSKVTEECFQKNVLEFATHVSYIAWNSRDPESSWKVIPTLDTNIGTTPKGSTWRRNPIPACSGPHGGFNNADNSCPQGTQFPAPGPGLHGFSITRSGLNDIFKFSVVDKLKVPRNLPDGEYVLSWRWDNDQTPQIWNTCSSIRIKGDVPANNCKAGTYLKADGSCEECPENTYSAAGAVSCNPCPAKHKSAAGSSKCESTVVCSFRREINVGYWNDDMVDGRQNKKANEAACAAHCSSVEECLGYSYVLAAEGEYGRSCWLKRTLSDRRPNTNGVNSGVKECKEKEEEEEEGEEEEEKACTWVKMVAGKGALPMEKAIEKCDSDNSCNMLVCNKKNKCVVPQAVEENSSSKAKTYTLVKKCN